MPGRYSSLPNEIAGLLFTGRGVFTVAEAAAVDVKIGRIERLVRAGVLERVGRGVFASRAELAQANVWVTHAIRTRGFVRACPTETFAAGWSAVAVRGLRTMGKPPPAPTAVQPRDTSSGSSRTRYGVTRPAELLPRHRAQYAGCPTVGKAWMAVDLARHAPPAAALVVADAVLADGTTPAGLDRALADMRGWPGSNAAAWVVEHADGRAESALETLGRLSCLEYDVTLPLSNVWVGPGYPLYRVDHLWPWHWVVAEADGALKYRDATDPAAIVGNEKERQWRLERELGLDVVRYGWRLAAYHRDELAARFRQVLATNPIRSEPVQWWSTDRPYIGQNGAYVA